MQFSPQPLLHKNTPVTQCIQPSTRILTISPGAVGVLAAIIALIAYLDLRRTNKENAHVVALAERYIEKEGAEAMIALISEQMKDLPQLARIAVLQEQ